MSFLNDWEKRRKVGLSIFYSSFEKYFEFSSFFLSGQAACISPCIHQFSCGRVERWCSRGCWVSLSCVSLAWWLEGKKIENKSGGGIIYLNSWKNTWILLVCTYSTGQGPGHTYELPSPLPFRKPYGPWKKHFQVICKMLYIVYNGSVAQARHLALLRSDTEYPWSSLSWLVCWRGSKIIFICLLDFYPTLHTKQAQGG